MAPSDIGAISLKSGDARGVRLGLKLAASVLVVAAIGLPINGLLDYTLLVVATVTIFTALALPRPGRWLGALVIVALTILMRVFVAAPVIEEGHNVFLADGRPSALSEMLPPEAFRIMRAEFDAQYPPAKRCNPHVMGCWRQQGFPDRAFAFSADGIFQKPAFSRRVSGIDFNDAIWLRLGFINELRYNWFSGTSEISRLEREHGLRKVLHPWRLTMPFFVMYRFPADFVGSKLCWHGLVLWEGDNETFAALHHDKMDCRAIDSADIDRRVFGVAIRHDSNLAMRLDPTWATRFRQALGPALTLLSVGATIVLLGCWRPRRLVLPFTLLGLALVVVFFNDVSFIGGVRPFDGGDDGLVYDGYSRMMLQLLMHGDIIGALRGVEPVFYFTPGLRYFRAIEHLVFGETYFGYLSLVLLMPFLCLAMFRRFLEVHWALVLTLIFVAVPVGAVFGSTFFQYVKWAARGFADSAAAIFFIGAFVVLLGRSPQGPDDRMMPALGAGFLFALALFVRPNLAPGTAVLLTGAAVAALRQKQHRRVGGLCIGFFPVFGMALHNWYYGGVFVLFGSNSALPVTLAMPPSAYLAAMRELLRFDFAGEHALGAVRQVANLLSGPSESYAAIPFGIGGIVILIRVAADKRFDPWLRLTAVAALAEHCVPLFYLYAGRYYDVSWLLTLLVAVVWIKAEAFDWWRARYPGWSDWVARQPASKVLLRGLVWCERVAALG